MVRCLAISLVFFGARALRQGDGNADKTGEVPTMFVAHTNTSDPANADDVLVIHAGEEVDIQRIGGVIRKDTMFITSIGWENDPSTMRSIDLDVFAVPFSSEQKLLKAVSYHRPRWSGLHYTGDHLKGGKGADDETIDVELADVPNEFNHIFFVVNVFSLLREKVNFNDIIRPYCRILTRDGEELVRYELHNQEGKSGLIIAELEHHENGVWKFEAHGQPCDGRDYLDCLPEMQKILEGNAGKGLRIAKDRTSELTAKLESTPAGQEKITRLAGAAAEAEAEAAAEAAAKAAASASPAEAEQAEQGEQAAALSTLAPATPPLPLEQDRSPDAVAVADQVAAPLGDVDCGSDPKYVWLSVLQGGGFRLYDKDNAQLLERAWSAGHTSLDLVIRGEYRRVQLRKAPIVNFIPMEGAKSLIRIKLTDGAKTKFDVEEDIPQKRLRLKEGSRYRLPQATTPCDGCAEKGVPIMDTAVCAAKRVSWVMISPKDGTLVPFSEEDSGNIEAAWKGGKKSLKAYDPRRGKELADALTVELTPTFVVTYTSQYHKQDFGKLRRIDMRRIDMADPRIAVIKKTNYPFYHAMDLTRMMAGAKIMTAEEKHVVVTS